MIARCFVAGHCLYRWIVAQVAGRVNEIPLGTKFGLDPMRIGFFSRLNVFHSV